MDGRQQTNFAIGIDVGGTKIAGGLVNVATGEVKHLRRVPTPSESGDAVTGAVRQMINSIADQAKSEVGLVEQVGVAVPELVDLDGIVRSGYRIRWNGRDLAAELGGPWRITIEADVRASALAESRFGHGWGLGSFYFATVGTGVSGTLVVGGRPYPGAHGAALVIGNGQIRHTCPNCGYDDRYLMEDRASGTGISAEYGGNTSSETVLERATAGESKARAVVEQAASELGRVLALIADALDPEAIIVGGGLGSASGIFHDCLQAELEAGIWKFNNERHLPLLRARTGPSAGVIGAAFAASQCADTEIN